MRLLLLCLPVLLIAGEAATIAPTGEELVLLGRLNEHRRDHETGNRWVYTALQAGPATDDRQYWDATGASKQDAPPVIMNPKLLAVARQLLSDKVRPPALKPYDVLPAVRSSGYGETQEALAAFCVEAPTLHLAYVNMMLNKIGEVPVDVRKLPDFLGRTATLPKWREAGVAVTGQAGRWSAVIVLAPGTAKRHLGGVVFNDLNRDGLYDIGEGVAGATVSHGASSCATGPGGAWWLSDDGDAAGEVAFASGKLAAQRPIAAGATCQSIDWRVPIAADCTAADKLIASAEKAAAITDSVKRRVPLANLLAGTRQAALDDARQAKVDALTESIREDFDKTRQRILQAVGEEPADFKKVLATEQRMWSGAMSAWFKEASGLHALRQKVQAALIATKGQQEAMAKPLLKPLRDALASTCEPSFRKLYLGWLEEIEAVISSAAPPKGK